MRVAVVLFNGKKGQAQSFIEKHDLLDDLVSVKAGHALRQKMKQGSFIVIDGFKFREDEGEIDILRKKYLYKIIFLDLQSNISSIPYRLLENCSLISENAIGKKKNFKTWLDGKIFPLKEILTRYDSVYHIGDIQGCYNPLETFLSNHFNDRSFYIFCGDYLDRGPENDKVFSVLYEKLMGKPNVRLLWGNHESDLIRWANGRPLKIVDFRETTRPQLERAGITPQMAYTFCRNLRDVFAYRFGEKNIVCSHGGLLDVPRRFLTIDSTQVRGERTKDLKDVFEDRPVVMHRSFNRAAQGTPWIQVHGHTNAERHEICALTGTVLLNDYPEVGGNVRVWRLRRGGPCTGEPIKIPSVLPTGFKYGSAA